MTEKKRWKDKCDALFSKIVRRVGFCIETKVKYNLQCAHIVSRSYHATAWDLDNAVCLFKNRHCYYTHHPVEWENFVNETIGEEKHKELKKRALNYKAMKLSDYKELYARLKADWDSGEGGE